MTNVLVPNTFKYINNRILTGTKLKLIYNKRKATPLSNVPLTLSCANIVSEK